MGRSLAVAHSGIPGCKDSVIVAGVVSKEETQEFLREGQSLWRGLTSCTSGSSRDQEGAWETTLTGVLFRISL